MPQIDDDAKDCFVDQSSDGSNGEIVVLTGSSGCLGVQTLKLLISHDDDTAEIRCLDLVEPSEWAKISVQEELNKFENAIHNQCRGSISKRVKYIQGDIRDIKKVEACLDGADCVIHCAAKVDIWVDPHDQDALELESINVLGTENLLTACVRLGVPKFVHVSSFEIFASYHTIYNSSERTLPVSRWLLFGASAQSKMDAEAKVRQYSNKKLEQARSTLFNDLTKADAHRSRRTTDSLNAVIVRFAPIYGPGDKYFVSRLLRIAKSLNGTLFHFVHVWVRQQWIFVGNAAWSLIKAKQRMQSDDTISGEDFHITDETRTANPIDFIEPFAACKGVKVSKTSLPGLPIWFLMVMFASLRKWFIALGFLSNRHGMDVNEDKDETCRSSDSPADRETTLRWYHLITSQTFYFIINSLFLDRTKANRILDYEPLFDQEESVRLSLDWYKNHLQL